MGTTHPPSKRIACALIGLPGAALLGGIAYSRRFVDHAMHLPPALTGERRELSGRAGRVSYYVAGQGTPLLLIHSINAAASAYELKPLYDHYCTGRRVYALDLPGFGFSDRAAREYTPRLYADAILDVLDDICRDTGAAAVDALAISLGCEFLARAALEHPRRFASLALVAPTGLRERDELYGEAASVRGAPAVRRAFEIPLWSRPLYDLLTSRASMRYFLAKTFGAYHTIDQGLLEYGYLSAHQPGAQHAPYAFIAGLLFSADISRVYRSLTMPIYAAHGVRGDFTDYGGLPPLAEQRGWQVQVFETGALPYFEQPEQFIASYSSFLAQVLARSV